MENQIFRDINTVLDLNGPVLSFTTQPTGVTGIGVTAGTTGGGTVELTGIATVSFIDGSAVNRGSISYQWYEQGGTKVSNGTYITGAATTTLTLSNLITPDDNQRKFYVEADYIPNPQAGIGYSSGNATNEPLNSGIGTVTVTPMLEIIAQPSSSQAAVNTNRTFTVNAGLTDNSYTDDLQYQWIADGVDITDGVETSTSTTTTGSRVASTSPSPVSRSWSSPASHTVPATATNVRVTLAGAQGGNGGNDAGGPGGRGGQGRIGTLTLTSGKQRRLEFSMGKRGNGGSSGNQSAGGMGGPGISGGHGGGAGQHGWSGGGGGGGGATGVKDTNLSNNFIGIAGGGGGGGGGSWNRGAPSAYNVQGRVGFGFGGGSYPTFLPARGGHDGQTKNGDGGGGGGGGGGANIPHPASGGPSGGSGGSSGQDNSHGGSPGYGGVSGYDNTESSFASGSGSLNEGDGYAYLSYIGTKVTYVDTTSTKTVTESTTYAGALTKSLTIRSDFTNVKDIKCRITSATASNSPILTDQVNFAVLDKVQDSIINIEEIGITDTANISTINLVNGEYTFNIGVQDGGSTSSEYYVLYSPDRDIEVEMDLYGGKGEEDTLGSGDPNAKTETGEGGYSRIQFTLKQNVEYVIAGLTEDIQAPFLYMKGELMAVVGGGGGGGYFAPGRGGGAGGGINIAGENGNSTGGGGGEGGVVIDEGTLSANGIFGSLYSQPIILTQGVSAMQQILHAGDSYAEGRTGGRTTKCSKGKYWAQQGKGACEDIGTVKFRLGDGTEVTNTSASITRGYKAGYYMMATAGWGQRGYQNIISSNGGNGGNGATGGQGGVLAGGGGGSGYTDGSVTVIDTMRGGSTGDAKVVLRVVSD
jgi:hypothetical protein